MVKELDQHKVPPFCLDAAHYSQPLAPFCLRFGSGPNTVGNMTTLANAADLPQSMLIDYVRVYKKTDEKATPILTTDGIAQMCIDTLNPAASEKILWAPYYPGVTYEWSAPWFDLFPVSTTIPQLPGRMLVRAKPGIIPNQFYPVYLKATFPDTLNEFDTLMVYLPGSPPPLPQLNFAFAQIDTLCYFEIRKPAFSSLSRAEYSTNGGAAWVPARLVQTTDGPFFCFDTVRPETSLTKAWREWNGCGVSPEIRATITTPVPTTGCRWPAGLNENNENLGVDASQGISVSPCPVVDKLTVDLGSSTDATTQNIRLEIFDLAGKRIVSVSLAHGINTLNLSVIKPGMFFIRIIGNKGVLFYKKWIKQ